MFMNKDNLKLREELRKSFCEHYLTLSEDKNGVMMFYYGKSDIIPLPDDLNIEVLNPFGFTMMTHHIGSNLTETEFYEKLNNLESTPDFICYVGEDNQFINESFIKLNSEEYKEYVEKIKTEYGIR